MGIRVSDETLLDLVMYPHHVVSFTSLSGFFFCPRHRLCVPQKIGRCCRLAGSLSPPSTLSKCCKMVPHIRHTLNLFIVLIEVMVPLCLFIVGDSPRRISCVKNFQIQTLTKTGKTSQSLIICCQRSPHCRRHNGHNAGSLY